MGYWLGEVWGVLFRIFLTFPMIRDISISDEPLLTFFPIPLFDRSRVEYIWWDLLCEGGVYMVYLEDRLMGELGREGKELEREGKGSRGREEGRELQVLRN